MRAFISTNRKAAPKVYWGKPVKVHNTEECGITHVEHTIDRKLRVVEKGHFFRSKARVSKVIIISSQKHKERFTRQSVDVEADLYLEDGRVVEMYTCDSELIQTLLKYVQVADPRTPYRALRGI